MWSDIKWSQTGGYSPQNGNRLDGLSNGRTVCVCVCVMYTLELNKIINGIERCVC